MEKQKRNSSSGITLIALVISIIVMLILAGVSINAIVGDNGIISQAQSASMRMGMAALEEYLQEEYIGYFDDEDDYVNKVELLADKKPNMLLQSSSTRKYVVYGGKAYYLINKANLPDSIKEGLRGGDSSDVADFTKLYDVYGVTPELKVYYVDKRNGTEYGNVESTTIDPNTPVSILNNGSNESVKNAIAQQLRDIGVKVDDELGITTGNLSSLKTLTLDGSTTNITSLKAISELTGLQQLTLKNVTLANLDGIENLSVLNYIYLYNCNISDYSKLSSVYKLQRLYFHFLSSMDTATTNAQITNLGKALKNATKMTSLQYFGAYGVNLDNSMTYPWWNDELSAGYFSGYTSSTRSNLTDISGLADFADNIKKSIRYIRLNNNNIGSVAALSEFTNLYDLMMMCNSNLVSLTGLENHKSLTYLAAHSCNITSVTGLSGTTNLRNLTLQDNVNLTSLSGTEENVNLISLLLRHCNMTDIAAVQNFTNLQVLYLDNNANLEHVAPIANCTRIVKLYLGNNNNMIGSEVALLQDRFNNCGLNYSVPTKYYAQMENLNSYDYLNYGLTATSNEFKALKGKTNITRLRLQGNTSLSNTDLNETLKTMTGLRYLSLNGLSNLTSIDWIKSVPNLVELDLRGTKVTSATDIALLNTYGTHLITLIVDNKDINIKDIEDTLVNVNANWNSGNLDSWIHRDSASCRGPICLSSSYDFSKITKLTTWRCYQLNVNSSIFLDLSNCPNLKTVAIFSNCSYKLPASVETLSMGNGAPTFNLSLCNKLRAIDTSNTTGANLIASVITLPNNNVLENLYTYIAGTSYSNLNFLGQFNASKLKTLTMVGYSQYSNGLSNIEGLQYAPNVTYLNITNTSVSNLNGIQYLTNLETFYANNQFSKISDISYLSNLTKLKNVSLNGNKISSIPDLSNLTQLGTLNLANNYISSVEPLSVLIKNGSTTLRNLNLSGNNLEEYTSSGYDNIQLLKSLKAAGTSSISISNNNFEYEMTI